MSVKQLLSRIKSRLDRQFVEPVRRSRRAGANANRVLNPMFVTGAMGSGTTLLGFELCQRFKTSGIVDESCLVAPKDAYLHVGNDRPPTGTSCQRGCCGAGLIRSIDRVTLAERNRNAAL